MTEQAWWGIALQAGLWALVMAIVMGWLARTRDRARSTSAARHLAYPRSLLIVSLFCGLFFVALAVVSNVFPNETATGWTTAVFLGLSLLGLPGVSAYVLEHYAVSEDGISGKDFIGRAKQLSWPELRSVRYGALMKWFRLESPGSVVRVSAMLMGLPEFAQICLRRAPQAAIDPTTRAVLEATAAGNPPSVWA